MKLVKFSILALALGVFATSCSGNKTEESTTVTTDSTVMAPEATTVVTDTVMAAPAATNTDSMSTMTPAGSATTTTSMHTEEGHTGAAHHSTTKETKSTEKKTN